MKSLLLVGGGGHSCIDVIESTKTYEIEGVVQLTTSSELVVGYPVIGSNNDLPQLLKNSKLALITVGQIKTPNLRIELFNLLKQLGAELPIVVSPKAHFSKHSLLMRGQLLCTE